MTRGSEPAPVFEDLVNARGLSVDTVDIVDHSDRVLRSFVSFEWGPDDELRFLA